MPQYCSAHLCSNRRTIDFRARGITFHKFPKDKDLRKKWELATRRERFSASKACVLCSEHFKPEDFDRTGQTVRLREGVVPSKFKLPAHLQKREKRRTTLTSRKAEASPPIASPVVPKASTSKPPPSSDHCYALPDSLPTVAAKLKEALTRLESLEREKKNVEAREKRAKVTIQSLLEELKEKNLLNEDLKERLDFYSALQLDFMKMKGNEYTEELREFALTLHLLGPKAYRYLRETRKFPLPHPHTLQRWLGSADDKPELRTMLDTLEESLQEEQSEYEIVSLVLDATEITNPEEEVVQFTVE